MKITKGYVRPQSRRREQMGAATSNRSAQFAPPQPYALGNEGHEHIVQLYTHHGALLDVLSGSVGGALASGDAAIVVATATHRKELEKRLSGTGIAIAK